MSKSVQLMSGLTNTADVPLKRSIDPRRSDCDDRPSDGHGHPHGADHPARSRRPSLADDFRARDLRATSAMKPARVIAALIGALMLVGVGVRLGVDSLALSRLAVLGAALGLIVRDDLREHRIPNRVVLPAALACAMLSLLEGLRLSSLVEGGVLLVLLLGLGLARPAWIGMGDVKLALLILCGLHGATPRAFLFAIELAIGVALLLSLRRGREAFRLALPLAPFLAAGSLLALLI